MANLPPKQIPVGEISKLADPFEILMKAPGMDAKTRQQLEVAVGNLKQQQLLLNDKLRALNAQVQALLALADWTRIRP